MAGSVAGGKKAAQTNRERYGDDMYSVIGSIGGLARVPKGFAKNRELASKVGRIGGSKSRRGQRGLRNVLRPSEAELRARWQERAQEARMAILARQKASE